MLDTIEQCQKNTKQNKELRILYLAKFYLIYISSDLKRFQQIKHPFLKIVLATERLQVNIEVR